MRVTAAAVGVAHTFEVVTQTECAAAICFWHWCAGRFCRLLHGFSQSEPWSNLEVGEWCKIFYRHLRCVCGCVPSLLRWRRGI